MTASVDFTSVSTCSGGGHYSIGTILAINGQQRTRTVSVDSDALTGPITDEELEAFVKVCLRIIRAQNPPNLRTAVLNKVVNFDV